MATKPCKDCQSTTRQMINPKTSKPYPGPRCCTCHRAKVKSDKERNHSNYTGRTYGKQWEGKYDLLLEFQGKACFICKRAKGTSKKLAWDHDHKCCNDKISCGECVRGLLCGQCNKMLGHARDEPEFFIRAWHYLMDPPAKKYQKGS